MALRWNDWARGELAAPPMPRPLDSSQTIRDLVHDYSIEITPQQAGKLGSIGELLPEATKVFITHLPGANLADTVELARRLKREGLIPVPHLAARNLTTPEELKQFLEGLCAVDVNELLLIAGGGPSAAGPYANTRKLLETGLIGRGHFRKIFFAGHPEGHPAAGEADLEAALRHKNAVVEETGIAAEIITQFGFDGDSACAWEERMFRAGNRLPVRFGVAGPTSIAGLLKYASMCGVSASARFLGQHGAKVSRLATDHAPDAMITRFAEHRAEVGPERIAGIHFFPFGGLAKTARWADAVRMGSFRRHLGTTGFTVF